MMVVIAALPSRLGLELPLAFLSRAGQRPTKQFLFFLVLTGDQIYIIINIIMVYYNYAGHQGRAFKLLFQHLNINHDPARCVT